MRGLHPWQEPELLTVVERYRDELAAWSCRGKSEESIGPVEKAADDIIKWCLVNVKAGEPSAKDRRVLELTEALQEIRGLDCPRNYSKAGIPLFLCAVGIARRALDKHYRDVPTDAPPSCGETVRPSSPEGEELRRDALEAAISALPNEETP